MADFDDLSINADFILGHNILSHDIPHLSKLAPDLALLQKPLIDTLYLSPLAFPENSYHCLIKDYQIIRDNVCGKSLQFLIDQLMAGSISLPE